MLATHQWCQRSMKFIKKRNLGEIKKNGRREGDLHLLLQEVTYLAWVAIRPEKGKDINKKNTKKWWKRKRQSSSVEIQPEISDM